MKLIIVLRDEVAIAKNDLYADLFAMSQASQKEE
jgi:hypothetical protein